MADTKPKLKANGGPRVGLRALFFQKRMAEKPLAAIVVKEFGPTEVRLVIFTPEGTIMQSPPDRVIVVPDVDLSDPDLPDNCCIIER